MDKPLTLRDLLALLDNVIGKSCVQPPDVLTLLRVEAIKMAEQKDREA